MTSRVPLWFLPTMFQKPAFDKGYDRVSWVFLQAMILKLGFSPTWVQWIEALYIEFALVVQINAQHSPTFELLRLKDGVE